VHGSSQSIHATIIFIYARRYLPTPFREVIISLLCTRRNDGDTRTKHGRYRVFELSSPSSFPVPGFGTRNQWFPSMHSHQWVRAYCLLLIGFLSFQSRLEPTCLLACCDRKSNSLSRTYLPPPDRLQQTQVEIRAVCPTAASHSLSCSGDSGRLSAIILVGLTTAYHLSVSGILASTGSVIFTPWLKR
jgi:hypothetical protein